MAIVLNADKISKSFGDQKIFDSFSFQLYSGDRMGIVGANGAGKTTLLRIIAGLESPDEGSVKVYTSLSYIRQQDDGVPEATKPFASGDSRFAGGLGFNSRNSLGGLSGGEKAKSRLIQAFDPSVGILVADEPTSNLDFESAEFIGNELKKFKGTLIIVSHDRSLLDMLCTSIMEVSNGKVSFFTGNYSDYVLQRKALFERQSFEYSAYLKERSRLKSRINERNENMKSVKKAPSRMGNSEARLHKRGVTAVQKKLSQSIDQLETRLDKLEKKERPDDLPEVAIKIAPPANPVASRVIRSRNLSVGYGGQLLIADSFFEIPNGKRTAILGKNGSGKTTLANLIYRCDERVEIAPGVQTGYFMQDFSILDNQRTVLENVMDGSTVPEHQARGILARLLISAKDVYKKVSLISGGEKVKISIAKLLVSKSNVVILDEPTNYLDVYSMEALEKVLCDYTGTLILISHDRKFVQNIAQRLLVIENNKIRTFEGTLDEYETSLKESAAPQKKSSNLDETIIKMRLADLSAKIHSCKDEKLKSELELQYQALIRGDNL